MFLCPPDQLTNLDALKPDLTSPHFSPHSILFHSPTSIPLLHPNPSLLSSPVTPNPSHPFIIPQPPTPSKSLCSSARSKSDLSLHYPTCQNPRNPKPSVTHHVASSPSSLCNTSTYTESSV